MAKLQLLAVESVAAQRLRCWGFPFLGRNESILRALVSAALDPILTLFAIIAANPTGLNSRAIWLSIPLLLSFISSGGLNLNIKTSSEWFQMVPSIFSSVVPCRSLTEVFLRPSFSSHKGWFESHPLTWNLPWDNTLSLSAVSLQWSSLPFVQLGSTCRLHNHTVWLLPPLTLLTNNQSYRWEGKAWHLAHDGHGRALWV